MLNKVVVASPVTQNRDAVKQLIAYFNHGQQPEEMPDFYRLKDEMVLVRSKKGDVYYVTSPKTCSCPSAIYNPGRPCKHSLRFFQPVAKPEQGDIRATLPGWRGPDGKRANGPIDECREAA